MPRSFSQALSHPSWYQQQAKDILPQPPITGNHVCDVAIIGGGLTGLSAALALAEKGFSIILLESGRIASSASGRNGGQICTGYTRSLKNYPQHLAESLWHISQTGKACIQRHIAEYRIACDYRMGYIHAATRRRHLDETASMATEWQKLGYDGTLQLRDATELRQHVNSPAYCGGLYESNAGQMNPLLYAYGLADAIRQHGGNIAEHSTVTHLKPYRTAHGTKIDILTTSARITSDYAILATDHSALPIAGLTLPLHRKIAGMASYILATESLDSGLADAILPQRDAVTDLNYILDYFRLDSENRLLFGGKFSALDLPPHRIQAALERKLQHVFPQLRNLKTASVWGGVIGLTTTRMPYLAQQDGCIFSLQGLSGQGIVLSHAMSKLVVDAIAGQSAGFHLLSALKHPDFPPEPVRQPLLSLAVLWHRIRDLL